MAVFGMKSEEPAFKRGVVDQMIGNAGQQDDGRINACGAHIVDEVDTRDSAQAVVTEDDVEACSCDSSTMACSDDDAVVTRSACASLPAALR